MSRYIMIRRLRAPVILLLIGTLSLLHRMGVVPYFWRLVWPLLLIALGLLLLAERVALGAEGYPSCPGSPWQGPWPVSNPPASPGAASGPAGVSPHPGVAIVPSRWQELQKPTEGGQS